VEGKCIIYSWTITVIILIYFIFLVYLVLKERMKLSTQTKLYNMNIIPEKTLGQRPPTSQVATQVPNTKVNSTMPPAPIDNANKMQKV
jgi:hypothetical protein